MKRIDTLRLTHMSWIKMEIRLIDTDKSCRIEAIIHGGDLEDETQTDIETLFLNDELPTGLGDTNLVWTAFQWEEYPYEKLVKTLAENSMKVDKLLLIVAKAKRLSSYMREGFAMRVNKKNIGVEFTLIADRFKATCISINVDLTTFDWWD